MNNKSKLVSIGKRTLIVLLISLVLIQFIHPAKNADAVINDHDFTRSYVMPDSVHQVLKRACFDCHSNYTVYPWYSKIQPVDWWLNDHIVDGKRHLNFSEFGTYTAKRRAKKMKEVAGTIDEGEMPLSSYTWIHKDAVLSPTEKKMIADWAKSIQQKIILDSNLHQ